VQILLFFAIFSYLNDLFFIPKMYLF
jgi:hypothetical protein